MLNHILGTATGKKYTSLDTCLKVCFEEEVTLSKVEYPYVIVILNKQNRTLVTNALYKITNVHDYLPYKSSHIPYT